VAIPSAETSLEKKFQCQNCDKSYSHNNSLIRHIQTVHQFLRFQCNLCSSEFTQKSSLTEHCRNLHSEKQLLSFECDCGRKFSSRKSLDAHYKTHEKEKEGENLTESEAQKKKYRKQCQICGFFFKHIEEHKLTHFGKGKIVEFLGFS
jgi:KRAB domain-containing zinc finger protein